MHVTKRASRHQRGRPHSPIRTVQVKGYIGYQGSTQLKLSAEFTSPVPLYLLTFGHGHKGMVRSMGPVGELLEYFAAMI